MAPPSWAVARFQAALTEARDDDPAARRARHLLRLMHADLSTLPVAGISRSERRALRLLLDHLASGFDPEARGTA